MSSTPGRSFEGALRGMLAARRPVDGAPAELRGRILAIPERIRPGAARRPSPVARIAGSVAGLAAAAAIALLVVGALASRPVVPDVGSSPAADAPVATFDPAIEGPGIVTPSDEYSPPPESLTLVPWVIAGVGGVLLAVVALTGGRVRRLAALAAVVVLAIGANALSSHPGFEMGYSVGPRMGLDVRAEPPPAAEGPGVWYVTAEPDGPVVFAFDVRNPGPLPIRLLGVVQRPDPGPSFPRWTAVWLHVDPGGGMPAVEEAMPFRQLEVPPDGHVVLYLVGRAGACAFGPSFRLEDADTGDFASSRHVRIAYAVLGLSSVGEVELPFTLAQPLREDCGGS